MERVLLYYPAINIPNGEWLRRTLLYTDKVSSIFPFESIQNYRVTNEMKFLYDEGQYQPIYVHQELEKLSNAGDLKEFDNKFMEIVKSEEFKKISDRVKMDDRFQHFGNYNYSISINKLSFNTQKFLKDYNLFLEINNDEAIVEKMIAVIYLTMLSNYLASKNENFVIPSTDDIEYERIGFQISDNKIPALKLKLTDCFPTPSDNAPLIDIIKFKKKRRLELLNFREVLGNFENEITSSEDEDQIKEIVIKFKEKIEKEVLEMEKLYGDSRIDFVLNSFSSLLDYNYKETAGIFGLGITGGGISGLAYSSFELVSTVGGLLILAGTMISSSTKIKRKIGSNSFSYIYYGKKSGITN